jgi:hypothetical protein
MSWPVESHTAMGPTGALRERVRLGIGSLSHYASRYSLRSRSVRSSHLNARLKSQRSDLLIMAFECSVSVPFSPEDWYSSRQASANTVHSTSSPLASSSFSPSRMTPLRQSTTVPNTSNTSAYASGERHRNSTCTGLICLMLPFLESLVSVRIPVGSTSNRDRGGSYLLCILSSKDEMGRMDRRLNDCQIERATLT